MVIAISIWLLPGDLAAQSDSQQQSRQANANRVRLKTTLSDKMVQSFLKGQSITVRIPTGQTAIGSLIVRRAESFKDEPAAVKPKITVKNSVALVDIPRSLFQRLDYQPLRIRIYESDLTRIELRPVEESADVSPELEPPAEVETNPEFFVRLKPSRGVPVVMKSEDGFRLTNDVFDHEIPFSVISGIYFDKRDQRKVTVVLDNGDNLTGEHHWPAIVKLDTKWGSEEVGLDEIMSVTLSSGTQVVDSGAKSPKWIVEEKK